MGRSGRALFFQGAEQLTRVRWMGRGVGNIIKQSLGGPVWAARVWPEENHFVSGNFAGFSLYISSEGSAKLRWVGREAHLGRGVAQQGAAQLRRAQLIQRVQRSSQGAAKLLGRCVAQIGCSIAQKAAVQLRRVQLSSEGAAYLRQGAAQLRWGAAQLR